MSHLAGGEWARSFGWLAIVRNLSLKTLFVVFYCLNVAVAFRNVQCSAAACEPAGARSRVKAAHWVSSDAAKKQECGGVGAAFQLLVHPAGGPASYDRGAAESPLPVGCTSFRAV